MRKIVALLFCSGVLIGCSTKKDAFGNRVYHSGTAWFNTLFNAEEELSKKIDEIESSYRDNYSEILPVDPRPEVEEGDLSDDFIQMQAVNLRGGGAGSAGSAAPATGFDAAEKKAIKAIEKHSMIIKGTEKNKMMSRAYLVLGKARLLKGNSFGALEAFNYMNDHLPYHKNYSPEAELYSAVAYLESGNISQGQRILGRLSADDGYKKPFKELVGKYSAQTLIKEKRYEEAINALDYTINNTKSKKRKARYYFIEGQLYTLLGDQNNAGEAFTTVYQMKPGFEMEVKSQLAIAANFDPEKNTYSSYRDHLMKVSQKGNYVSRKNEFYYAMGDIALKAGKEEDARKYLLESFKGDASDPYIRGLAYERFADLEFDEGNYVHAAAYYDSAKVVAPYEKDQKRIFERSNSLEKLMVKYYLVKKNDSILRIANMSKDERDEFFNDYIAKLKAEDARRQRQMEEEATVFRTDMKGGSGFNSTFGEGGNKSFYFYNNSLKSNGQNEFRRIWGNVKLTDNWRNPAGETQSLEDKEAALLGQTDTQNPRRYELAYYLEQVPTGKELDKLKTQRDTAELSLGIGYYDLFKNPITSTKTLEHLLSTPPKEQTTEAQAYYQLYRIFNKEENEAKAEEYKNLIFEKYPQSVYAEYILNPEFDFITPTTKEAMELYTETYEAYKEGNYPIVQTNMATALEKYPTEAIGAKFSLLNAMAIGKTQGREPYIHALELITVAYQNTPEAVKAQEILDVLNSMKRKPATPGMDDDEEEEKFATEEERVKAEEEKQKEAERKQRIEDRQKKMNERNTGNPGTNNRGRTTESNRTKVAKPAEKK